MKINVRAIIALVLIVALIYVVVDSLRERAYSGANLSFPFGSGPVTVTNPSDSAVPVRLVSADNRAFSVSTTVDGVASASTREGSGRETVYVSAFDLPPGEWVMTITRGRNITFTTETETILEATVQAMNANDTRNVLIGTVLAVLAGLYYISRTTGHRWMSLLRRQEAADALARKSAEQAAFKRILGRTTNPD
jgi:hypothetical protein